MDLQIQCLTNGDFYTNTYIITRGSEAWLIDAPSPAERIIRKLAERQLTLRGIYLTHGHADHIMALGELKRSFPEAEIAVGRADASLATSEECAHLLNHFGMREDVDIPPMDRLLDEGDETAFGYKVIETPGHTAGSVCFYNEDDGIIFTGDTLFEGSIGRTDLGGDHSQIMASLDKLKKLLVDDEIQILPGHGRFTRMGIERKTNPYL